MIMMNLAEIPMSFSNITSEHITIFLVGYSVVFTCLALLSIVFKSLPRILDSGRYLKNKFVAARKKKQAQIEETVESKEEFITGEEVAAISMALHLYVSDLHDEENRILTIKKISRRYSPWSSKIYSVTNGLNKKF